MNYKVALVEEVLALLFLIFALDLKRRNKPEDNTRIYSEAYAKILEKKQSEQKAEVDNYLYVIASLERPLRPYMSDDGKAFIIKGKEKTVKFIQKLKNTGLKPVRLTMNIAVLETALCTFGFDGYEIDGVYKQIRNHPGTRLERAVYKCLQRNNYPAVLSRNHLNDYEFETIKKELNALPLLVAFVYDKENPMDSIYDGVLHMTQKAHNVFVNIEDTYFGISKLCPGKEIAVIRKDDKILYYGDKDNVNMANTGGKTMYPRVANNTQTKSTALTAYTNMESLKSFYKMTRCALFMFEELSEHVKETDGLMLDLGNGGVCALFDRQLTISLADTKLSSYNSSLN